MISNEHKLIAQGAMNFALKNGCQSCRISIISARNASFEYRDQQLDRLHQSSENKLYIELFVDGKYGSFATNRLDKKEIETFISEGIISTRYLAEDLYRQLPDSSRYYKLKSEDLDLFDNSFDSIPTENKLDILRESIAEIQDSDDRIISIAANYDDGCGAEYMIACNGFESESKDTAYSVSVEVALKTETDARPEAYWFDNAIYWSDLQKTGIAKTALDRALRKIGQKKVNSGKYTMLLDNTVSTRLLSPLLSAMYGSAIQQKNSFLIDKLDECIISPKITIFDTPHIRKAFGARYFDREGVATFDQTIIKNGILKTYFIDTYHALKMECEPTISSPSIVNMELGLQSFDELVSNTTKGIWVTGFNGGNTNSTTGDFSFGIEGFLVENGVVTQPIGEMNITGNILTLWQNVEAIGNDPRQKSSWKIPSIAFSEVNFSGL